MNSKLVITDFDSEKSSVFYPDSEVYEKRSISNSANMDIKQKILELAAKMAVMLLENN